MNKKYKCFYCNSEGFSEVVSDERAGGMAYVRKRRVKCEKCEGSGSVDFFTDVKVMVDCDCCYGTGMVVKKDLT